MVKKGIVGLLVLVVSIVIALTVVPFDATELGSAVLRRASASTGIHLKATRHRFRLLRGLELESVVASARFPGGRFAVAMPAIRFEHRLRSLVSGRLDVDRVVLVEPSVTVSAGSEGELFEAEPSPATPTRRQGRESEGAPRDGSESPVALRVRELELAGGSFTLNDEVTISGVNLSLLAPELRPGALTPLHALDASGDLSIAELWLEDFLVRNVRARLGLERGRVELERGTLAIDAGELEVEAQIDFNAFPARYRLALSGRLDEIPGEVRFEGSGFGLNATNLVGEGRWNVPAGRFGDAPLWQRLDLTGTAREAGEVSFRVTEGRLVLDGGWIRGTVGLDGALDLTVNGRRVSGSWNEPVVSPGPASRSGAMRFAPTTDRRETRPRLR